MKHKCFVHQRKAEWCVDLGFMERERGRTEGGSGMELPFYPSAQLSSVIVSPYWLALAESY